MFSLNKHSDSARRSLVETQKHREKQGGVGDICIDWGKGLIWNPISESLDVCVCTYTHYWEPWVPLGAQARRSIRPSRTNLAPAARARRTDQVWPALPPRAPPCHFTLRRFASHPPNIRPHRTRQCYDCLNWILWRYGICYFGLNIYDQGECIAYDTYFSQKVVFAC